jgi:beta-lactamase regulating signal transducer with metallopeptidase domain
LTGQEPSGSTANTTLSNDQATFVSGVFAAVVTPTKSRVQPPIQTLVVASGSPFVLPGLNILIFPIGAIITGIWTVLFLATIAYGTIGRMQFREQYRRRAARAQKGDMARI